jgi:elongation factor P
MAILYEGKPCRVMEFEHRTPGNLPAFVQVTLRNLVDGRQRQVKFMASEVVERAHIDTRAMDYLYQDGDGYVFMDVENYEQITIPGDFLGDLAAWLVDGMRVEVQLLDGQPIGLELPKTVEIEVVEAEPVVKGQTAAKSNKPAKLANGVMVQVPPFVKAGDRIRVDPAERRYIERVK